VACTVEQPSLGAGGRCLKALDHRREHRRVRRRSGGWRILAW
jgi:hypothetical protein